ncbi:MAG: hypothetical protein AAGJ35_04685 [Myxococcota bacterium]
MVQFRRPSKGTIKSGYTPVSREATQDTNTAALPQETTSSNQKHADNSPKEAIIRKALFGTAATFTFLATLAPHVPAQIALDTINLLPQKTQELVAQTTEDLKQFVDDGAADSCDGPHCSGSSDNTSSGSFDYGDAPSPSRPSPPRPSIPNHPTGGPSKPSTSYETDVDTYTPAEPTEYTKSGGHSTLASSIAELRGDLDRIPLSARSSYDDAFGDAVQALNSAEANYARGMTTTSSSEHDDYNQYVERGNSYVRNARSEIESYFKRRDEILSNLEDLESHRPYTFEANNAYRLEANRLRNEAIREASGSLGLT